MNYSYVNFFNSLLLLITLVLCLSTAKMIAVQLSSLQAFNITTNIGGHGVVGVLKNGPGKTILLRADMDALPVEEPHDAPYRSRNALPNYRRAQYTEQHGSDAG